MDCPFCVILAGGGQPTDLTEWDGAASFQPLHPATPGHRLVIPDCHVTSIAYLHPPELELLMRAVRDECAIATAFTGVEGLNVVIQQGEAGGQSVDHLHVHVVPRRDGDGLGYRWGDG